VLGLTGAEKISVGCSGTSDSSASGIVAAGVMGSSTVDGARGGVATRSDTAEGTGDCSGSDATDGV